MIKAVIFDYDDTLVESRAAKWAQHKHVAKKFYNIDLTDEDLLKHWGKPLQKLLGFLYKNSDTPEKMMEAVLSCRNMFPKKLNKGAVETINKILDRGFKVGILSATTKLYLKEGLEGFGFPVDKFFVIQGSDDTDVHKPDPDVFLSVLKKLKEDRIEKNEILYIGDSLDDLVASHGAGINFIAITTGIYSKEDFEKNGAKVIVDDIKDVLKKIN